MVALLWRNERSQRVSSTSPDICHIYIICIYHIYYTMSYPAVGTGDAPDIAGEAGRGQEPGGQQETQTRPHLTSLLQSPFCSDLSAVTFLKWSLCLSAVISRQWPLCSDLSAVISLQLSLCSHRSAVTLLAVLSLDYTKYEIECEWNPTPVDEFYFPGKTLNISISHNFNSNKFSIHI